MIALSWNCRELENSWIVQYLYFLVEDKWPKLVFLTETKIDSKQMEIIRKRLGFGVGSLVLLWRNCDNAKILSYSQYHIFAQVVDNQVNAKWLMTGFYGYPETYQRPNLWNVLREIRPNDQLSWMEVISMKSSSTMKRLVVSREVRDLCRIFGWI